MGEEKLLIEVKKQRVFSKNNQIKRRFVEELKDNREEGAHHHQHT